MGGEIKWDALAAITEYLGVTDVTLLIDGLVAISNHKREEAAAAAQAHAAQQRKG